MRTTTLEFTMSLAQQPQEQEKLVNLEKQGKNKPSPKGGKGCGSGGVVVDKKKYTVKKRPPPKSVPQRPNDIYISDRSNFKAQISKCQKLFESGDFSEIFLHGIGSSIPRAVNVALELKTFYQGTIDYSVNTSTIQLIDDLIPLDDTTPPSQQSRKVSCVDIRVFRTVKIP